MGIFGSLIPQMYEKEQVSVSSSFEKRLFEELVVNVCLGLL